MFCARQLITPIALGAHFATRRTKHDSAGAKLGIEIADESPGSGHILSRFMRKTAIRTSEIHLPPAMHLSFEPSQIRANRKFPFMFRLKNVPKESVVMNSWCIASGKSKY
jgi:hypothetical protein